MTLAPGAGFLGAAVPELALRSDSAMPFSKALDGRIVSLHGVWHLGKPTHSGHSVADFPYPGAVSLLSHSGRARQAFRRLCGRGRKPKLPLALLKSRCPVISAFADAGSRRLEWYPMCHDPIEILCVIGRRFG